MEITNGSLVLEGHQEDLLEKNEENRSYGQLKRRERRYGRFYRRLALPYNVDESKCTSTFSNGVLEINIPKLPITKAEEKHGKRISIE